MNEVVVLDGYEGYDFGAHKPKHRKSRRKRMSPKQARHARRFAKAAKSCARARKGSFKSCMKKKLKKGRR